MIRLYAYITIFCLFFSVELVAQNVNNLKTEKEKNEKDIKYINGLLKKTLASKKVSIGQLNLLNQNISLRENIIRTVETELNIVEQQLGKAKEEIRLLAKDLNQMKQQYAQFIKYAYKQRKPHEKLMFILASKDINQAYKRFKYLQQIIASIEKQGERIEAKKKTISNYVLQLEKKKQKKEALLTLKNEEKRKLAEQKREQHQIVQKLQKRERQLRSDLRKQKRYARKLEREIQRIIRLEAKRKKHTKTGKYNLTPEEKKLSQQFGDNRGKLPWPTETGFISQKFGKHQHPILKHVNVRNDGIDITTDTNAICRAVFSGEVSHVLPMPGLNNVILIKHGAYFTVYSNLISVNVKKGDIVTLKQKLGTVYTDKKKKQTILKFQIWKGSSKLNPARWLSRRN